MIDEAFMALRSMLVQMLPMPGEIVDDGQGVRLRITACEIESPIELYVVRDERDLVAIGSTPPLYSVNSTFKPSIHQICFHVEVSEASDGN